MKHVTEERVFHCLREVLPRHPSVVRSQAKKLGSTRQFDLVEGKVGDREVLQMQLVFVVKPPTLQVVEDGPPPIHRIAGAALQDLLHELSPNGEPIALEFALQVVEAQGE